jgi:hypothetical protein
VLLNNALERRTHDVLAAMDLELFNEGALDDFVTGCLGDEGIVLQRDRVIGGDTSGIDEAIAEFERDAERGPDDGPDGPVDS